MAPYYYSAYHGHGYPGYDQHQPSQLTMGGCTGGGAGDNAYRLGYYAPQRMRYNGARPVNYGYDQCSYTPNPGGLNAVARLANHARQPIYSTQNHNFYGRGSAYTGGAAKDRGGLQRQNSGVLGRSGSLFGGMSLGSGYGSFYNPRTTSQALGQNNGATPQYRTNYTPGLSRMGSFSRANSFQFRSNDQNFGSAYGFQSNDEASISKQPSEYRLQSVYSFANMCPSSDPPEQVSANAPSGIPQEPRPISSSAAAPSEEPSGGLQRNNSMRLMRVNSSMNGFYNFGQTARLQNMSNRGGKGLTQGRLMERPKAPPYWTDSAQTALKAQPTLPSPPVVNSNPQWKEPPAPEQLKRCNSEKRIGFYFKDVKPSVKEEYKKENEVETNRNSGNASSSDMTNVRTILLLESDGGKVIEVDGPTAVVAKPSSDELVRFDHTEIVNFQSGDTNVHIDTLDELCDAFLAGCNVGLLLADAHCPASQPKSWFTWNALRRLVKDAFAKMPSRCELRVSISLLDDDRVKDLLASRPTYVNLTVANSPLFGNVPDGMTYRVADSAMEFNTLLLKGLEMAEDDSQEEFGILLVTAILKQVRGDSPHSKKNEDDVILSSIFASGVGSGIIHYSRILDKNPAEPRAMYQFALGGPSLTAAILSVSDRPGNAPSIHPSLSTLNRLGQIKNFQLRLGSLNRFITYTRESIPKTEERMNSMPESTAKEMLKRSIVRYKTMLADAEAMIKSPDHAVPRAYVRS
ncbi:hypothetical protein TRVL_00264 [Trypanosoma vivax]|nr:hypothetical protein TRVL_00264 [Trypanosoma vivax]